jgi:AraC-like DNA-binding protein
MPDMSWLKRFMMKPRGAARRGRASVFARFLASSMFVLILPYALLIGCAQFIIVKERGALTLNTQASLDQRMQRIEMRISSIDIHYAGKVMYEPDIINALSGVTPPIDTADEVLTLQRAYTRMRYLFMSIDNQITVVLIEPDAEIIISNRHASVGLNNFLRSQYGNAIDYQALRARLLDNAADKRLFREEGQGYESSGAAVVYAQILPAANRRGKDFLMATYFSDAQVWGQDESAIGARDYMYLQNDKRERLTTLAGTQCEQTPTISVERARSLQNTLVLNSESAARGLTLTAVIQTNDALRPFIVLRLFIYALLACVTLIDLALCVYLARRDAQPLQRVFSLVDTNQTAQKRYIDSMRAVLDAVSSAHSLKDAVDKQNAMLRGALFDQLLFSRSPEQTVVPVKQLAERYGLTFDRRVLAVLVIDIVSISPDETPADYSGIIRKRIADALGQSGYLHDFNQSIFVCLVTLNQNDGMIILRETASRIRDALLPFDRISFHIGASDIDPSPEALPKLFAHAYRALEEAALSNQAICYYLRRHAMLAEYAYPPNQQARLTTLMRMGDAEGVSQLLRELDAHNASLYAPRNASAILLASELLGTVFKVVRDIDRSVLSSAVMDELDRVSRELEFGHLAIEFQGIQRLCAMVASDIGEYGRGAQWNKARGYIEEHYADPMLGIQHIEKLLGLSSTSVKRLFNEAHGEGVSHYIESVRLRKACELLQKDAHTVGGIATIVGYTTLASFSRAFKRVTGVSPIQYRAAYKPED